MIVQIDNTFYQVDKELDKLKHGQYFIRKVFNGYPFRYVLMLVKVKFIDNAYNSSNLTANCLRITGQWKIRKLNT